MSDEKDLLLDHEYDGIQELDNKMPSWWVTLFILTFIFAIAYMFYYHVAKLGDLQLQEYASEFPKEGEGGAKKSTGFTNGELFAPSPDNKEMVAKGEKVFQANCASCHRADAGGTVGPNLTDDNWIHGGAFTDIVWTIVNGVPEKGMLSWRKILSKDDILATANYIRSLHGSNPPNPKAPEGAVWDGTEKLPK